MACMTGELDEGGCGTGEGECGRGGEGCRTGVSCGGSLPPETAYGQAGLRLCSKCKDGVPAQTLGNQTEPMCAGCLRASVLAKFKTTVNNYGLITSSDKVLVAISGGSSSRVALELLKDIRLKAQNDADAAKDRGLQVFGLGTVFVNEAIVLKLTECDAQAAVEKIRAVFSDDSEGSPPLHIVGLESVYECGESESLRKSAGLDSSGSDTLHEVVDNSDSKLSHLFESVEDSTGKEDLLEYLRMQAIQKVAQEFGYTKVVLGLNTTRIAAQIIVATTKGRGYSLSGEIQYLDSRWSVPVVLPLRDIVSRELALYCYFAKLETVFIKGFTTMANPRSSLNNLAHHFVTLLQEENPSREHTIVRTAAKLKAFSFNEMVVPPSRRRRNARASNQDLSQSNELDILCPICSAPVNKNDILKSQGNSCNSQVIANSMDNGKNKSELVFELKSTCCPSCLYQIFPEEGNQASEKYLLFPESIRKHSSTSFATQQKWLRSQIDDYLILEGDDGNEVS